MRCVALFSGGLDSQLAVRIMQQQGLEVEAFNFQSVFTTCQEQAVLAAQRLGVRLTVFSQEDDYLDVIRNPRFGYGRGANPCLDCRIYMFRHAFRFMEQVEAQFLVSGDVVGQRPMSQKRRDLETIAHHAGHYDLLLRPLSAKLLAPTLPEREGWVDREKLYAFFGRGRRKMIALGRALGLEKIPAPSAGCALTEPSFAVKVYDLLRNQPASDTWDFELLKYGRHFRYDERVRVIVGRREAENTQLQHLHALPTASSTALLSPVGFAGPVALVVGSPTEDALQFACGLIFRYAKLREGGGRDICVQLGDHHQQMMTAQPHAGAQQASTLAAS